ncbi:hypothetical protein AYI68_g6151 [Smittium mucronatum]|uniref:Uncharacterized protein n=1 Tax=Smittium mucronatum TaxID=133383 RepID=A0A1R0GSA9_9FUNG|nr:hypothetical protein AYI68_g6151 [Smittium mucronatum]
MSSELSNFFDGAYTSVIAVAYILKTPKKLEPIIKSAIIVAVTALLTKIILTIVLYFVLHIGFLVSTFLFSVFEFETEQVKDFYDMAGDTIGFVLNGAPFFLLELYTRIQPSRFEDVFFSSMDYFDVSYSETLQNRRPTTSFWGELFFTFESSAKRVLLFKATNLFSIIPYVGVISFPISYFILLKDMIGIHLSALISLAILSFPIFDDYTAQPLLMILSFRELITNYMRPYMRRSLLSRNEQIQVFINNYLFFFGFSILFYLTSLIPLVGPIFYTIGFAAIALPIAKIAQKMEVLEIAEKNKLGSALELSDQ